MYEAIRYRSGTGQDDRRRSTRRERSTGNRVAAFVMLATAVLAAYLRILRPWHMSWGATGAEAHGHVAGDELMPNAQIVSTRVIEIDAPPSAIWPWLAQMGPGRGGAYTYDWIERPLRIDIRNVDRIVPELQNLNVGDEIEMSGYKMRVERLDAPHDQTASRESRPSTNLGRHYERGEPVPRPNLPRRRDAAATVSEN